MNLAEYQSIERTKAVYKYLRTLLIGTGMMSILSFFVLWQAHNHLYLSVWLFCLLAVLTIRGLSFQRYKKAVITQHNAHFWINKSALNSLFVGIIWGIGLLLFLSIDHPAQTGYIVLVYFGLISSSVPSVALHYQSHVVFAVPITVLFVVKCLYIGFSPGEDSYIYLLIIVAVILYLGVMTSFAKNTQSAFNETTRLAFENRVLVDEILKQKEAAEGAVLVKNQFLAAASHDLRQPLHALGLYASVFNSLELSPQAKKVADQIKQSTDSLSDLLNGLLDVSRLDAAAVEYRPRHILFSPMLELLIREYELIAKKKGSVIKADIEPDLYIYSDELLLQRAIRNLVDNAVKFTDNGEIIISVKKKNNNSNEAIELIVKDTGLGIPDDEHKRIFSEFTQLHNPERDRQKGLGLGLAIVQRLCNLMNIQLTMDSILGEGTQFVLQLPSGSVDLTTNFSEKKSENSIGESSRAMKKERDFVSFLGKIILVIDDEIVILNAMQALLKQWDADVITAMDIDEAIEKSHFRDVTPDLILADFRLRDNINGTQAIEAIRDEFNELIPALLITGDTSPDRLKLAKSSNLPILHKPVDAMKLNQTLCGLFC